MTDHEWCIEKAIEFMKIEGTQGDLINIAKKIRMFVDKGTFIVKPEVEDLYYDQNTLRKVSDALRETSGDNRISTFQATELITSMQNAGILFREKRKAQ